MKHFYFFLFGSFFCVFLEAQSDSALAASFIRKLERKQYDSCFAMMDTTMQAKLPPSLLEQIWEILPGRIGDYSGHEYASSEKKDSVSVFLYRLKFEKMKLDMRISVRSGKVAGTLFTPPKNNKAYTPPEYYQPETFYETKFNVKTGNYELPGILCMPNNIANPPVVILLAGSGAHDKDESIGPLKMLKDLAVGLAARGIASLRYDKRTLVYGEEILKNNVPLGINEEVVDDAVNAAALLKKSALTAGSKIIVAGHSLGAMCAPLIAAKSKHVDAVILLAGNSRPLEDVIAEQCSYLSGPDSLTNEGKAELDNIRVQVKTVKDSSKLKKAKTNELPLGLPSFYWQSIKNYNQVAVAKKLKQPILVLQGERDYQVTMEDFRIWNVELSPQTKNRFISYPDLNHNFVSGKGKATPAEYDKQGNVAIEVIRDIADWIKSK